VVARWQFEPEVQVALDSPYQPPQPRVRDHRIAVFRGTYLDLCNKSQEFQTPCPCQAASQAWHSRTFSPAGKTDRIRIV
jgi:hypothetical protein